MGNWRTVTIVGTCPPDELDALRATTDPHRGGEYKNWHPLVVTRGLCGTGDWTGEHIDASGNLSERDYSVEDVRDALVKIRYEVPGLRVKVHCGGEWESPECVATVICDAVGVYIGPPEVERIRGASTDEAVGRLSQQLWG